MSQQKYAEMVQALTKEGAQIKREMTATDADLLHMAVGVSGEAGELLDAVKKAVIYRKSLDRQNLIEELGDLEFYMERIRQIIDVSRDEVIEANMAKLNVRYQSGAYSNDQAKDRADKQGEME